MSRNMRHTGPDEQCPSSRCFYRQQQLYFAAPSLAVPSMQGTHCMSGEIFNVQIRVLEYVWPFARRREV